MSYSLNNIPPPFGTDVSGWTGASFVPNGGGVWSTYEWIVVVGALSAFGMAWSIGANDVANSFATSVGARTITLWQACIIASIFEFCGAVFLGGEVAKTVAGSITSPSYFASEPEIFMFGMLCTLITAGLVVSLATYLELAISTTHSIIGAVMGFGLAYGGVSAIMWAKPKSDFPFISGFVPVVISWFASPLLAGVVAAFLFFLNRTLVLRSDNAVNRAFVAFPVLVAVTVFINVFFVLFKGAKNELHWKDTKAAWVAACATAGAVVLAIPGMIWLKRRHKATMEAMERQDVEADQKSADLATTSQEGADKQQQEPPKGIFGKIKAHLIYSLTVDVHEDVAKDEQVSQMHANAEVFSPAAENVYKNLQVFSACCVSFAHGANDVANAVGPFAGMWYVYENKKISSSAPMPKWILVLGASGIVIGLGTYGYKIIKVLGVKMATMTPSRGFSAELATALTISVASVYGLPISTTQCIVGAEMGIGLLEDWRHGANWRLFAKTFCAWVGSICVTAAATAAIFSFCVYAPSKINLDTIRLYEQAMTNAMGVQIVSLNNTNNANNATLGPAFYSRAVAGNVSGINTNLTALRNYKQYGAPDPRNYLFLLKNSTALALNQTVPVVGFNRAATTNSTTGIVVPAFAPTA